MRTATRIFLVVLLFALAIWSVASVKAGEPPRSAGGDDVVIDTTFHYGSVRAGVAHITTKQP